MNDKRPNTVAALSKLLVCILFFSQFAAKSDADDIPLWSRERSFHPVGGYHPEDRFSLRGITQNGLHLTGECMFFQLAGQKPNLAAIEGTKTTGGEFWPDVTAQVRNEQTAKWETIAEPFNHGHRATITIKPGDFVADLKVSLDVFYPLIGKHKVGRLVLKSGETAVFDLKDLLEDPAEAEKRPAR